MKSARNRLIFVWTKKKKKLPADGGDGQQHAQLDE
jgi:hypothetical protein